MDSKKQRTIMGKFATGVTVAATARNGETWGMTANAVTSLSLDPPLVLLAVSRDSQSLQKFSEAGCYSLNILSADQEAISNRFAWLGPKDFSGLDYRTAVTGSPILAGGLGWVDCRIVEILRGGDHDVLIGHIEDGDCRDGRPLLYFAGAYAQLGT
jgi:3-hydroxy-9,10-secoandrosta-1,3,5(10)-triene-9,17-dione monooxygenase reductase component